MTNTTTTKSSTLKPEVDRFNAAKRLIFQLPETSRQFELDSKTAKKKIEEVRKRFQKLSKSEKANQVANFQIELEAIQSEYALKFCRIKREASTTSCNR